MRCVPVFVGLLLLAQLGVGQSVSGRTGLREPVAKLNNRAVGLVETGSYAEALRLLDAAINQQKNDTLTFNRAMLLARLGRHAEALAALSSVSYLPGGQLNRGILACRLGRWADGLADIQAAPIEKDRADERAFDLAVANWQVGRPTEASRALNEAGPAVSDPTALRLLEADLLLLDNKPTEAAARYNKLGRADGTRPGAALRLAQVRLRGQLYDEAATLFQEAMAGDPKNKTTQFLGHYGLGMSWYAQRNYAGAATEFKAAVRADPTSGIAQTSLAHALCSHHDYKAALDAYQKALVLDPDNQQTRLGMAIVLVRLVRPLDALKAFKAAEALLNPTDTLMADAWLHRGMALLAINLPIPALTAFETANTLRPGQAGLLAAISEANRRAGRLVPAVQTLSEALAVEPQNLTMRTNRGSMLLQLDRVEDAYVDFLNVLRVKPKHIDALNGMGLALLDMDKLDEARFTFDGLVGLGSNKPHLHNNRGVVESYAGLRAEKQGQPAEAARAFALARDEFGNAQSFDSTGLVYQTNLGNAYRNLGELDEAARAYQRFLSQAAKNNLGILLASRNRTEARRYLEAAVLADTSDQTAKDNRLRFYRTNHPDSVALRSDLQRDARHRYPAGVSAKYSRDGYRTAYTYDFAFDAYDYPADHRFGIQPEPLRPPDLQSAETFLTMLELPYTESQSRPVMVVIKPKPVRKDTVATVAAATLPPSVSASPGSATALARAATPAKPPLASGRAVVVPIKLPVSATKPAVAAVPVSVSRRQKMPRFPRTNRRKWGRTDCFER